MKNIDNFSAFHNFRFEVSGVRRMWKAFTVGIGKLIPYDELYITHQKACGLLIGVEEEFSSPREPRTLKPGKKHYENQNECEGDGGFICTEQNCFKSFHSLDDLEMHVSLGQHCQCHCQLLRWTTASMGPLILYNFWRKSAKDEFDPEQSK